MPVLPPPSFESTPEPDEIRKVNKHQRVGNVGGNCVEALDAGTNLCEGENFSRHNNESSSVVY